MFKKLQRDRDKDFKHIAPGLIPAASIAPKPAVPRTPPPRSPDPSPERQRSALAAAILSSSLTGQTWAIPPVRPRSFSESDHSESLLSEPHFSTAGYTRDRWSDTDLPVRQPLSSSDHSDKELEDKEEEEEEEEEEDEEEEDEDEQTDDREDHIYQTLDGGDTSFLTEPVYALPIKPKTRACPPAQMSGSGRPAPDFTEESIVQSPVASCDSSKKKIGKSSCRQKEAVPPILTTDLPTQAKSQNPPSRPSSEPPKALDREQREAARAPPKKARVADEPKLLEERLLRLEQHISHSQSSSTQRSPAGSQAELQTLRQHAQELVDENDALKLTVHRLNVELSRYQTRFRPLSKQESAKISGLPKTGSPPPWLLDIKYLSPLLLAYEDRMNERDALLQTTEEKVKRLRVRVEEVIKENERLHDEIARIREVSQKDCQQLQQQALLVSQENQALIDQLEAQRAKAKASHSRHHSEVSKVSKQLMLLEAENQRFQEELEESRREAQKNTRQVQVLQARLKDAITWDEHCSIAGKLRGQLEQQEKQENGNKSAMEQLLLRVSSLQDENRSLALDKANLSADMKRMEAELELCRQDNRKAEQKMCALKQQKEECVLKAEKTRHYLGAVISLAEHISQERDQLQHMASDLQQEKEHFISRILNGTVRFGKLQDKVKVYRRQASSRLAALEEAAEGRTASHRREILHLQRLLRDRQEAEERLLQSKREVEEELEVVWQAAIRENQQMNETLLDSRQTEDIHGLPVSSRASPVWPPQALAETTSPTRRTRHSFGSPLVSSDRGPGLQRRSVFKTDPGHLNDSADEKHKHGLDFYC